MNNSLTTVVWAAITIRKTSSSPMARARKVTTNTVTRSPIRCLDSATAASSERKRVSGTTLKASTLLHPLLREPTTKWTQPWKFKYLRSSNLRPIVVQTIGTQQMKLLQDNLILWINFISLTASHLTTCMITLTLKTFKMRTNRHHLCTSLSLGLTNLRINTVAPRREAWCLASTS